MAPSPVPPRSCRAPRALAWGLAVAAAGACRRPSSPARAASPEAQDKTAVLAPAVLPPAPPEGCALVRAGALEGLSSGAPGGLELGAVLPLEGRALAAAYDRAARAVLLLREGATAPLARWSLAEFAPREVGAPLLAARGASVYAALVSDEARGRVHRLARLEGEGEAAALRAAGRGGETRDDGLALSACATQRGLLLVWDDEGPGDNAVLRAELVPDNAPSNRVAPSAASADAFVSDLVHDAAEPLLLCRSDGAGAMLVYLAAREVEAETANQSVADLVARALDARGAARGPAVRLTNTPAMRFAVAGLLRSDGVWLAYRVAGEADHTSRGDGGAVALLRLASEDLRPVGEAVVVTGDDANPTGQPALLDAGADGVVVHWAERRGGEATTSVRRGVRPNGTFTGPPRDEPALAGLVPRGGAAAAPLLVGLGAAGPVFARARCPRL